MQRGLHPEGGLHPGWSTFQKGLHCRGVCIGIRSTSGQYASYWNTFLFIKVVEDDLNVQQAQINNIEVDVSLHDERLGVVEDDVDEWDDKITALEVANVDLTDRLITVEEILLGNVICWIFLLPMFLFNLLHRNRKRCKMSLCDCFRAVGGLCEFTLWQWRLLHRRQRRYFRLYVQGRVFWSHVPIL